MFYRYMVRFYHKDLVSKSHKDLSSVSKDLNIRFKSINMLPSLKKFTIQEER